MLLKIVTAILCIGFVNLMMYVFTIDNRLDELIKKVNQLENNLDIKEN